MITLSVMTIVSGSAESTKGGSEMCKTLKSWKLQCPCCGAKESITLDLNDLQLITCTQCEDTFGPQVAVKMVADQLRRWQAVSSWIRFAGAILDAPSNETEPDVEPETEAGDRARVNRVVTRQRSGALAWWYRSGPVVEPSPPR